MAYPIDNSTIENIVRQIVEQWSGGPLSADEQNILDQFMQEEVEPLNSLEILERMGTPADTINWFMDYMQARIARQSCENVPPTDESCHCFAC